MKASSVSHLVVFLFVPLFASINAQAEDETGFTNRSIWNGEPGVKETLLTTNVASAEGPIDSVNSATSSSCIKKTTPPVSRPETTGHVATLAVSDLREYEAQSPAVKRLLASALMLTTLNLGYQYGSSDPQRGGMDCSGTVYYLLNNFGLKKVPRDASGMYKWVWTHSRFQAVTSSNPDTFELAPLKPGDLLFWTGTYRVDHDPPVTHVMIYLGINRHSGHRVMVGASEGRPFDGKSRYGVSVFDFTMPAQRRSSDTVTDVSSATGLQSRFIGYGSIPGLEEVDGNHDSPK
jgi:peptidoglycan DL-endopeptidase CwlO